MNVRDAIAAAKNYIKEVYAEEEVSNLGLEETEFDDAADRWAITLGFSRPWNSPRGSAQRIVQELTAEMPRKRLYKVITVSGNGEVIAMKNRPRADSDE